jgi:serine protease Do
MTDRFLITSRVLLPVFVFATAALALPLQAESLQERQTRVMATVQKVGAAVVGITGASGQGSMGSGSGVIVSKDGLILTAGHVLAATGADLTITLPGGREVKGKSLGRDMNRDAALAQITEPGEYPFVEMAPEDSVEVGEWVLALGHPGGYDPQRGAPLRVGRLWENDSKAYFRSDCTVSGGDSGGPLFDLEGRVVGIHSSISQNLSENRHVPIGVFAKDMERLKKGDVWGKLSNLMPGMKDAEEWDEPKARPGRAERESDENRPQRRAPRAEPPVEPEAAPTKNKVYLGVQLEALEDKSGVQVVEVADGSPAAKAGLELEDIITKIDGEAVTENGDIVSKVQSAKAGDKLQLTVKRGDSEKQLEVTLAPAG